MADRSALKSIVETSNIREAVRAIADPGRRQAAQLDLLPLSPTEAADPAPAIAPAAGDPTGRGGRPKGALNRSTRELREFFARKYRSPLEVMFETFSRPVADLARELGCTLLEAFELQQKAAAEAAPYFHQKLSPLQDALDKGGLVSLTIDTRAPDGQVAAADRGDMLVIEGELISDDDNPDNSTG